jgi:hypothetical protein
MNKAHRNIGMVEMKMLNRSIIGDEVQIFFHNRHNNSLAYGGQGLGSGLRINYGRRNLDSYISATGLV